MLGFILVSAIFSILADLEGQLHSVCQALPQCIRYVDQRFQCQVKDIHISFAKNGKFDGGNRQTYAVSITRDPRKENCESISDEVLQPGF